MHNRVRHILLLSITLGLCAGGYYSFAALNKTRLATATTTAGEHSFREKNKKLFKELGLVYLKNIEILYQAVSKIDVKHTERYLKNPGHYDNLEKKYGVLIARGYIPPLSIQYINDKIGYGVFAEADIELGQMVGEYTGRIINVSDLKSAKYAWVYLMAHDQYGKPVVASLDAATAGNEMRFVNHDYNPNAAMQFVPQGGVWHAVYIANRPIKKGEQVLTDYGKKYWSGDRGEPHQFVKADGSQNKV